jgi:hypothetical protein
MPVESGGAVRPDDFRGALRFITNNERISSGPHRIIWRIFVLYFAFVFLYFVLYFCFIIFLYSFLYILHCFRRTQAHSGGPATYQAGLCSISCVAEPFNVLVKR